MEDRVTCTATLMGERIPVVTSHSQRGGEIHVPAGTPGEGQRLDETLVSPGHLLLKTAVWEPEVPEVLSNTMEGDRVAHIACILSIRTHITQAH